MRTNQLILIAGLLAVMPVGVATVSAAAPGTPLTAAGNTLEQKYADQFKALQAEITGVLPVIAEQEKVALQKARDAVKVAEKEASATQAALEANKELEGLSNQAARAVAEAEATVREATAAVNGANPGDAAKVLAESKEALAKAKKNYAELDPGEIKKSQEAVDKAKSDGPKLAQANQVALDALARAQTNELEAAKVILTKMDPFLKSDKLDAKLVLCAVLARATPRGLAEFAQQGNEQEALVGKLLADTAMMEQMLEAGGAKAGKYGQAMKIYTDILKASPRAKDGVLQRLALGTSLEHAVPLTIGGWSDEYTRLKPAGTKTPVVVIDPVQRYLHYEKAYLAGELDPAFKDMTAWECRYITDNEAPDQMLAWGREMLRNYRPDHILTTDHGWRYSRIVKTDVAYSSSFNYKDSDSLEFVQNVIKNGGICGRRAVFGRFIIQSFGLPSWGVHQPGHAAIGRWTPSGWVVNLGAKWKYSDFDGRSGLDFELETQARKVPGDYRKVLRAQWVSDALGAPKRDSLMAGIGELWNVMSIYEEMRIVAEAKMVQLAAVGQDIGEANVSKVKSAIETVTVTEEDRKVVVAPDGVITIPSVACSTPTNSTEKIVFMKSFLGGLQLHYNRLAKPEAFEYIIDAPEAGRYSLRARVVTVSSDQHLLVAANDAKEPYDIAVPYTLGKWGQTPPVEIQLGKGKNVLRFTRNEPVKGLTIKDFTLRPVK
jgi:hypothetical protein